MRYARAIRLQYVNRKHTTLQKHVPLEAKLKFLNLVTIDENGVGTITKKFQTAIDSAVTEANERLEHQKRKP